MGKHMTHEDDSAVGVHITNFEDLIFRTEETEPEHFSFQTIILEPGQSGGQVGTGGQGSAQLLLALDPLRKDASIVSIDSAIALCDSPAQAGRPWNTVNGLLVPDGAYTPAGVPIALAGTGAVYGSTQAITRVCVIINRRAS
jgi:hypothetical protein